MAGILPSRIVPTPDHFLREPDGPSRVFIRDEGSDEFP
jgi:hypothetical protein